MRRQTKLLLKLALGIIGGLALAPFSVNMAGGGFALHLAPAYACGIGPTATMLANKEPALSYPLPQGGNTSDLPLGLFALNYTVNQTIAFTEDLSKLPTKVDPNAYGWQWDFGDGSHASGISVTHTYAKPGDFKIVVNLTDPSNAQNDTPNIDSAQIHVIPQPFDSLPVAIAHGSAKYVQINSSITYDATGSHALTGGALTYTWNFGDGTEATGAHVTHVFQSLGQPVNSGNVTLIVQDARGARALATVPVVVALFLPTAGLTVAATKIHSGDSVSFDASKSAAPQAVQGDTIATYQWSFGDGGNQTTTTPTTTHTYSQPGTFTATVQAFDTQGVPGTTSVVIHVSDPGFLGMGSRAPLVLGGIGALIVLALGGNWLRARNDERRRIALIAAKRARARSSKGNAQRRRRG